jgi:hypothetical protein
MNEDFKNELQELADVEPFQPFVVTANTGFAIAVRSPKRMLVSRSMLVVTEESGRLHHFPFTGIAHITQAE